MGRSRKIKSSDDLELAITRFERIMQEQHQPHKKEIKTLKKAINQQTMFSTKLDDLLEQPDQTEQLGSSN